MSALQSGASARWADSLLVLIIPLGLTECWVSLPLRRLGSVGGCLQLKGMFQAVLLTFQKEERKGWWHSACSVAVYSPSGPACSGVLGADLGAALRPCRTLPCSAATCVAPETRARQLSGGHVVGWTKSGGRWQEQVRRNKGQELLSPPLD